jgi:6-pyruvoyl-tetrahydropterin synthase
MTVSLTKQYGFSCVTILENSIDNHFNMFGHNYMMDVTVAGEFVEDNPNTPNEGIILDQELFDDIINDNILKDINNAILYNEKNKTSKLTIDKIKEIYPQQKVFDFKNRPTVETMSEILRQRLRQVLPGNLRCTKIVVYETSTVSATSVP